MKILHLEDNPHDVELTREIFTEEWPGCRINAVCSRDDFLRELAAGNHDVILSDFQMAGFNGMEALHLAREKQPATPFIFLSGTIGEDRAVEALRNGASDYVIKDRPKRLVPAVKRALDEARLVRERREAQEQLLRAQRLENIGMLASGIAHDFNNVLAPVLMAIPLLRDRLSDPSDQRILNTVEKSVERGAGLVRQILGFAHGVTGEAHLIQPKHIFRDLINVLRQTLPRNIVIEDSFDADLWPLKVNPTQLHQILLNLCVNARDAMPNGGTLRLGVTNIRFDELRAASVPGTKSGPYLRFEVADTGTGIPPEVLQRIWEPFFTTKGKDRGTGLGLPTVRSIVESHHGVITLHSHVGRGTTFQVFLPAAPECKLSDDITPGTHVPEGHGELILVVDDDENVRDVTTAMLTRHGYRVLAAANGTEAVALFAPRSLEIKLIISDLSMPELDGMALAKVARNLQPAARILVVSGLADAADRLRRHSLDVHFLPKPFNSEALLLRVHDLISTPSAVLRA